MDNAEARAKLLDHPKEFLRYYPVKCAGADAPAQNAVNLRQYNISKLGGTQDDNKVGHRGATRPGFGGKLLNISSFILQPDAMGNGAIINQAHVVPMVNHNSDIYGKLNLGGVINAMPYYELDDHGDGLMVTGELSNCCFCWLPHGADLWCIHVQPAGGIDATDLEDALDANGRFAAAVGSPLGTYGRHEYPAGRASVIGVRRHGDWHLFAQTSDDSFSTISGAYSIYPGVMRRL